MCGISGYIGPNEIPLGRIEECLALMKRRGPDHQGYRHFISPAGKNVYLLSSWLAIIDLDPRANQPMEGLGSYLVFNGEIYNYRELRYRLGLLFPGSGYKTESDTEVLQSICDVALDLASSVSGDPLEEMAQGLDAVEGMWIFALYDEIEGSLYLSRDRSGEKPLYFYQDDSGFYFGSEPEFIFALLGRRLPINYEYLVKGSKRLLLDDQGLDYRDQPFLGLNELPPGSIMRISTDGKQTFAP